MLDTNAGFVCMYIHIHYYFFFRDLISGEGVVFEIGASDIPPEENEISYSPEEILDYTKLECLGLVDEELYSAEPFTALGEKMTNVTPDGKIKKKVIREGYGETPRDGQDVTIHYNAYLEYNDEPFDSTYIRKKPLTFEIGGGTALFGVDQAVRTMKTNEKAQFLVHYDYAYGKLGCLGRIPAEATILFEIELLKYLNSEALSWFNKLNDEEQKEFQNIYKYSQAMCLKAKELVNSNIKLAIREYNSIASKLEYAELKNYEEQEKQQAILMRIYTNLVVCNMKINEPRKTCINANKIFNLIKGTDFKVPVKVYFNVAKAYRLLGEYDQAEKYLEKAKKLEPGSTAIGEEQIILDKEKSERNEMEKNMVRKMFIGK